MSSSLATQWRKSVKQEFKAECDEEQLEEELKEEQPVVEQPEAGGGELEDAEEEMARPVGLVAHDFDEEELEEAEEELQLVDYIEFEQPPLKRVLSQTSEAVRAPALLPSWYASTPGRVSSSGALPVSSASSSSSTRIAEPQPQHVPPQTGDASVDANDIVIVSCKDAPMLEHKDLLENVLHRCQDHGQILSHFVDHQGWLWLRFHTSHQAAKMKKRLHNNRVLQDRYLLQCHTTCASMWPPGMAPPKLQGRGGFEPIPDHLRGYGKLPSGGQRKRRQTWNWEESDWKWHDDEWKWPDSSGHRAWQLSSSSASATTSTASHSTWRPSSASSTTWERSSASSTTWDRSSSSARRWGPTPPKDPPPVPPPPLPPLKVTPPWRVA